MGCLPLLLIEFASGLGGGPQHGHHSPPAPKTPAPPRGWSGFGVGSVKEPPPPRRRRCDGPKRAVFRGKWFWSAGTGSHPSLRRPPPDWSKETSPPGVREKKPSGTASPTPAVSGAGARRRPHGLLHLAMPPPSSDGTVVNAPVSSNATTLSRGFLPPLRVPVFVLGSSSKENRPPQLAFLVTHKAGLRGPMHHTPPQ